MPVYVVQLFFFCIFFHQNRTKHKKRKDSLETRIISMIILLEVELSLVVVQGIHQNSKKWLLLVDIFLVKMTFKML